MTRFCLCATLGLTLLGCVRQDPASVPETSAAEPALQPVPAVEPPAAAPSPPDPVETIEVTSEAPPEPPNVQPPPAPPGRGGQNGGRGSGVDSAESDVDPDASVQRTAFCAADDENTFVGQSISGIWAGRYDCDPVIELLATNDPNFVLAEHYRVRSSSCGGTWQPNPPPEDPNGTIWWLNDDRTVRCFIRGEFHGNHYRKVGDILIGGIRTLPWPPLGETRVYQRNVGSSTGNSATVSVTTVEESFTVNTDRIEVHYQGSEFRANGSLRATIEGREFRMFEQTAEGQIRICIEGEEIAAVHRRNGALRARVRLLLDCAGEMESHPP